MARILIIDDDKLVCMALADMAASMGHDVRWMQSIAGGLKEAETFEPDIVLLDVALPDGNGLEALPTILNTTSVPEVIIITGRGDASGAELAITAGAWDYIEKPTSIQGLKIPLLRAVQYREKKMTRAAAVSLKTEGLVGQSPRMAACRDLLAQAAGVDASVLITGETGTGKEVFARAIHENSRRASRPFVVVDCAALPPTLVESVLFGHEKGAYTGADRAQEGLVKQAHLGTLFLDEVGELPLSVQKTFLRVLQEHVFRPVGGEQETASDFRLISATNRDLDQSVKTGEFRQDLLFRLRTFTISLPPLRDRPEDLNELALYHMGRLCAQYGIGAKRFSPEFFQALAAYDWPGNVRELVNALESALSAGRMEDKLYAKHLPVHIRIHAARVSLKKDDLPPAESSSAYDLEEEFPTLRDYRMAAAAEAEKQYLRSLLNHVNDDLKKACRISGLSRSRFYELLKKHQIPIAG